MKLLFFTLTILVLVHCRQKRDPYSNTTGIPPSRLAILDTNNYTLIQFDDPVKNMGSIQAKDTVQVDFAFSNAGETPLYIASVTPACGCTVVDFPKDAIEKGGKGRISAKLATKNLVGGFEKSIGVVSNTRNGTRHSLVIKGLAITDSTRKNKLN